MTAIGLLETRLASTRLTKFFRSQTVTMISTSVQKANRATPVDKSSLLRSRAHTFCQTLVSPPSPKELLTEFFIPNADASKPIIFEHGPKWSTGRLPFLAREFVGVKGCEEYYDLLSRTLTMHLNEDSFPGEEGFVVDAERNQVCVVGRGKFESVKSGRSWDEQFSYVLGGWDEEGRLGRWDIWADPLSAWVAVGDDDIDRWKKGEHRS